MKNRNGLKMAILTMSVVQMATNAVASILADIAGTFPDVPFTMIQYLMTCPSLMVVLVSLVVAALNRRFSKRSIAAVGLGLVCLAGLGSFMLHNSLVLLYLWACILGIGIGLAIPVATSLISDYFEAGEQAGMMGYQTTAANVGSMIMTFGGSLLAALGWHYNYLIYLIAVPGIVFTILFVPAQKAAIRRNDRETTDLAGPKEKIPAQVIGKMVIAVFFMIVFYVGPTNISVYVQEKGIGVAAQAGTATTILLIGGAVAGILFGKIEKRTGLMVIPLGFFMLAAGYVLIALSSNMPLLYIGSFMVGTSNSLVLSKCMSCVMCSKRPERNTLYLSMVLALANLGTFLTPIVTTAARLVTGQETAMSRFLFTAVLGTAAIAATAFVFRKNKEASE